MTGVQTCALPISWRGLHQLVFGTETGESMKIRVLDVAKRELLGDFQAAAEFTESALWKKIYQEEFGQYGGDPYGASGGRRSGAPAGRGTGAPCFAMPACPFPVGAWLKGLRY